MTETIDKTEQMINYIASIYNCNIDELFSLDGSCLYPVNNRIMPYISTGLDLLNYKKIYVDIKNHKRMTIQHLMTYFNNTDIKGVIMIDKPRVDKIRLIFSEDVDYTMFKLSETGK